MALISYSCEGNLAASLKNFVQRAEDAFIKREDAILIQLNERILALTPVWEGEVIVNWNWSVGAPDFVHREPVETPEDPGHTNSMPLGNEPRRAANSIAPRQSLLNALRTKEPLDIWLTNSSESAVDLEYGLLPTPQRSRVDGAQGIVRLAIKEVLGSLQQQ